MNSRKYLHGTWKLAWRRRIGPLFWLLTIWVPIYWLTYEVILNPRSTTVSDALWDLLHGFLTPKWELWFLWSLAFYCLISKLLAPHSSRVIVAGLGAVSFLGVCTSDYHLRRLGLTWIADSYTWRSFVSYYFFFYCGHRYTSQILRLATLPLIATLIISFIIKYVIGNIEGISHTMFINGPLRLVDLLSGLMLAICYGRILSAFSILRTVGIATLPIYLIHSLIISALIEVFSYRPYFLGHNDPSIPITIGLSSVAISLAASKVLVEAGAGWLFRPPARLIGIHDRLLWQYQTRPD